MSKKKNSEDRYSIEESPMQPRNHKQIPPFYDNSYLILTQVASTQSDKFCNYSEYKK